MNKTTNGLYYEWQNGVCIINGSVDKRSELDVPATIDGRPVNEVLLTGFHPEVKKISFGKGVKTFSMDKVCNYCNVDELGLPDGMDNFSYDAFCGPSYASEIRVPKGIKKIDARDLASRSNLKKVWLPSTVKDVHEDAFLNSPAVLFEVAEDNPWFRGVDGALLSKDGKTLLKSYADSEGKAFIPAGVVEIGARCFCGSAAASATIPDEVEKIGRYAFYGCHELTRVVLPKGTTALDDYAFCRCERLADVTFAEGLTKIGRETFCECLSLKEVRLPETLLEVGVRAFGRCVSLKRVYFPKGVAKIDIASFFECSSLFDVYLPAEGAVEFGVVAFGETPNGLTLHSVAKDDFEKYAGENGLRFAADLS